MIGSLTADLKDSVDAGGFGEGFHKGIVSLLILRVNPPVRCTLCWVQLDLLKHRPEKVLM